MQASLTDANFTFHNKLQVRFRRFCNETYLLERGFYFAAGMLGHRVHHSRQSKAGSARRLHCRQGTG